LFAENKFLIDEDIFLNKKKKKEEKKKKKSRPHFKPTLIDYCPWQRLDASSDINCLDLSLQTKK
jgi:hypothetical protein